MNLTQAKGWINSKKIGSAYRAGETNRPRRQCHTQLHHVPCEREKFTSALPGDIFGLSRSRPL